ncbi:MAG: class I SAM-dependent methyltransferase [Candidatus Sericytochromatia bacterium]
MSAPHRDSHPPEADLASLQGVSETLLIPLFCRYWESLRPDGLIQDPVAVKVAETLLPALHTSPRGFHQDIVKRRWPSQLQVVLGLRTRHFDQLTLRFLAQHDHPQVVVLACGLDSRYERVGSPAVDWLEIDLPPVMALRERWLPAAPGVTRLAASVLDSAWLESLDLRRPTLILAEGLLLYLPKDQIRWLFREIAGTFAQAELAVEVAVDWVVQQMNGGLLTGQFQRQFRLERGTTYQGGLRSLHEPESWHPRLKALSKWTYFDRPEPRLGWMNAVAWTPFKGIQWVGRYQVGDA